METNELRYFISVAETQNIHKSSKLLNISPSAISKAISRLESELEVKLFEKVGRNILITKHGLKLKVDAAEILAIQHKIKGEYSLEGSGANLKFVGPEMAISNWAPKLVSKIKKKYQNLNFDICPTLNQEALEKVTSFQADIAIFCSEKSIRSEFFKKIEEVTFKCFISNRHKLSKVQSIHIKDLINYHFGVTNSSLLGLETDKKDGWRDDKFDRKNISVINSIETLKNLVSEGVSISYLPDYFGQKQKFKPLNIEGCPFVCKQNIYLVRNKYSINKIWSLL